MSLAKKVFTLAAPAALLALSACATPFSANVARYQVMPPPSGQSFIVEAANPRNRGGLEFGRYASLVSERLTAVGYTPAPDRAHATFVVVIDYGVDNGHEKVTTYPGFYGPGWGRGWGYGGRFGYRSAFSYGWNDPFWFGGGADVESYTFYVSHLDMVINRAVDGQRLFEGKARARSTNDSLPALVPNLVEAMFTNFPGRSGEEVKITIPPPDRAGYRAPQPTVKPVPAPTS
jgi:hypothetical protein